MTEIDSIEQRLRRTFQVVAEQPVPPGGDAEPWRNAPRSPSRRPRQLAVGGLAVIVVIVLVVFGVAYGPRSSRTTPGTQPGLGALTGGLRAVFAPSRPISPAVREEAAATMASRLRALGDIDSTVSTDRGTLVVSGPTLTRDQVRLVGSTGTFSIRPVLCGAPAYVAPARPGAPGSVSATGSSSGCEARYATTASNLDVNTTSGIPANTIGPDPIFTSSPSTPAQDEEPASSALLPADPVAGAQQYPRFVVGAVQFNNSDVNADIASVTAQFIRADAIWAVDITLTRSGATVWDALALLNFHSYIALELDGEVLSAPLLQPNQPTFSSFDGKMEISGNFTETEAKGLAAVIGSGPLPVPFSLQSLTPRR
ncbi:MAG TPA: hypothetical protein VMU64_10005 [Acidimicrobiales bacterium]|nr:hypothetical protein [Acidimicrobiales bacterium]